MLAFQTEPLRSDVEVTGPIEVRLWISSSAPDTDFTAKLVDVYPPGEDYPAAYAMNLCDSIQRGVVSGQLHGSKSLKRHNIDMATEGQKSHSNTWARLP